MSDKVKKPVPVKTANYAIQSTADNLESSYTGNWDIRNRLTSKDKKTGISKDTDTVIGRMQFGNTDEYGCSELKIDFSEMIPKSSYAEVLNPIVNYVCSNDKVKLIKICINGQSPEMLDALAALKFIPDDVDTQYLIFLPVVPNWGPIYMLFGMSIGMSCGLAINNMTMGMLCGMALGFLLGNALTTSQKKTQTQILENRRSNKVS